VSFLRTAATTTTLNSGQSADVVVAPGSAGKVTMLLGKGDGTFQINHGSPSYFISMGASNPTFVILPDMNMDGCADIVTANYQDQSVSIRLNVDCNGSQ
jgi:hypothetical protein